MSDKPTPKPKPARSAADKAEALAEKARKKSTMRQPPRDDTQGDLFISWVSEAALKDNHNVMEVSPGRLSKNDPHKEGSKLRYELVNGFIEIAAGANGMASIWDYDLVLMATSQLAEAANQWRAGKAEKPSRTISPLISDVLKFCRRDDGIQQYKEIEAALSRLVGTTIKIAHYVPTKKTGRLIEVVAEQPLIGGYKMVALSEKGRMVRVEIIMPEWVYQQIVEQEKSSILTVHPDYFLITGGIGRFVYRLARKTANKGTSEYTFKTLFERSGSTGEQKNFNRYLRQLIKANDLPEYDLRERKGADGPVLVMAYRKALEGSKDE
ncbi:replication initiator protein A [Azotobacter salinestris]|uniref:replication initiator protein A n=1 Tax=Azotobacter salinestris TaxID=69964 RepID=UPI001266B459|nr:replication initiator protein A [Azotobacter salinestris]